MPEKLEVIVAKLETRMGNGEKDRGHLWDAIKEVKGLVKEVEESVRVIDRRVTMIVGAGMVIQILVVPPVVAWAVHKVVGGH